jgi:hypothetical protein
LREVVEPKVTRWTRKPDVGLHVRGLGRAFLDILALAGMKAIALLVFLACFVAIAGIVVLRFSTPRPPAPEVVSGVRPVSVSVSGGWTEIKYKNVPTEFVPPMPDFANSPPPISIDIDTAAEGALIRVSALYLRPDTPGSVMLSDFPSADQDVIAADYDALRETVVMRCLYRKGAVAEVYHYWYRATPESARHVRLSARHPQHPLLQVHEGRLTCPATAADAGRSP